MSTLVEKLTTKKDLIVKNQKETIAYQKEVEAELDRVTKNIIAMGGAIKVIDELLAEEKADLLKVSDPPADL